MSLLNKITMFLVAFLIFCLGGISFVQGEGLPDLVVTSINAQSSVVSTNQPLRVSWTVKNQGDGEAGYQSQGGACFMDGIYLSTDDNLDDGDQYQMKTFFCFSQPLHSNDSYSQTTEIWISKVPSSGTYYLIAKADDGNIVYESNEQNNTLAIPITVKVPDLIVSNINAPSSANAGQEIEVSWTVGNQGDGEAWSKGGGYLGYWWKDSLYFSIDDRVDSTDKRLAEVVGPRRIPLPVGTSYTATKKIITPRVSSGTYYLIVKADSGNNRYELNEENNVLSRPIYVIGAPTLEIIDAKMVFPNELGIGLKVKYPEDCQQETLRKVRFSATINGKYVEKEIDITQYTRPGEEWGPVPGTQNQMFDINGKLLPTTPLKINLSDPNGDGISDDAVPRFKENERFELIGVAYWDGGPNSEESRKEVEIALPVVVLHGYIHPFGYPLPWWFGGNLVPYEIAYKDLGAFLRKEGYDNEDVWEFYDFKKYRTLWDPSDFTYTNPWNATPGKIKEDLDELLKEIWEHNYAGKVNFIGHSFGGLVARYYASVRPENVNKVITVGTPHKGATLFYKVAFSMGTKEEAEEKFTIREGVYTGEKNILLWTAPTYECLEDRSGQSIQLSFENTLEAGPVPNIKYYSIFNNQYDTDERLILEKKGSWYNVIEARPGSGDAYILAKSASAFGIPLPAFSDSKHHELLNNKEVQGKIFAILSTDDYGGVTFQNNNTYWSKEIVWPSGSNYDSIYIESGVSKAVFGLSWKGSNLDLILYDPNGREINRQAPNIAPNIDFIEGNNYEQYTILNPISGYWDMEIRAIDVPEGGEEYILITNLVTKTNQLPIADAGQDQVISAGAGCLATVTLDGRGSSDPDGDGLTYTWKEGATTLAMTTDPVKTATVTFSLSVHTITLTVDDSKGGAALDSVLVTVQDTTPPTIIAPLDVIASTGPGATVCGVIINDLGKSTASDNCPGVTITRSGGIPSGNFFPIGTTTITYTAKDAAGNLATAAQTVGVMDNTPPTISAASVNPSELWPPNNKMVDLTVNYNSADNCGQPACQISSVTSNEPISSSDYTIVDAHHVKLRADRLGSGNGRIYTITITCTDNARNSYSQALTVTVPHDQGKE